MKRVLVVVAILITINPLKGKSQVFNRDTFSSVIVNKDPRFDEMAAKQAEINKHSLATGPRRVNGFRIQAANTQNRDEANAVKAELLRRFPDQKSYLLYQAPNFRVRLGNFLTQKDASQLRKMISALYPGKGIYIVPDVVDYTPPQGEDPPKD
jgi:hypothetical protein